MNTVINKKITLATFKSFVKKNRENLFIMVSSRFDGMTDCVESVKQVPHKIEEDDYIKNTLGIKGLWLVGHSSDWFKHYEDDLFIGIEVSNCCGCFIVGVIK